MRSAARHVDGSWLAVVERGGAAGSNESIVVADEARHSLALEWVSASANPGKGGAVPRLAGASAATAWDWGHEPTGLVGRISLGAQPRASTRSAGHADPRQPLATKRKA